MNITFQGNPVTIKHEAVKENETLKPFTVIRNDMYFPQCTFPGYRCMQYGGRKVYQLRKGAKGCYRMCNIHGPAICS